ncbi:MAG: hypothetical protein ACI9YT_000791 [Halobacteriales archaeon]|jgi:hypothetical protein
MSDRTQTDDLLFREVQQGFLALKLVTEVRADGLYVKFSPLGRSFHPVPWSNVEAVRVTEYAPGDYGGWSWGVRVGPTGNKAYRLSGDQGVEIIRERGRRLFVGSDRPQELADAIATARR